MRTSSLLSRMARMDRAELVFRARVAARTEAGRLASTLQSARWNRKHLAARLTATAGPLARAVERLEAGDWLAAHHSLSEHFHCRDSRFPLSASSLPAIATIIRAAYPTAAADAKNRADALCRGEYDLLGYEALRWGPPESADEPDWHLDPVSGRRAPRRFWSRVPYLDPGCGDHKVTWELNRHQHWLTLGRAAWLVGDESYRDFFVRQLESWMRGNPPRVGTNWASMLELALRAISWVWALHLFVESPRSRRGDAAGLQPWTVDLLLGLDRQLVHVEENLSLYFSPNTHLTGEALGLYVCGCALPELVDAGRWADTGRRVLLQEIDRQVAPDGGHVERATIYHRYTLDFYLAALLFARITHDPSADRFADVCGRLATAARTMADAHGRLPVVGDDDGGSLFPICRREPTDIRDSLAIAAALLDRADLAVGPVPEEAVWFLGNQSLAPSIASPPRPRDTPAPHARSSALPDTGYFTSRPGPDDHVLIDGGPHGYLNGGHAHADALSMTVTLGGLPVFVDPGSLTYTVSREIRDRFRSSRMHNTLSLDGRSQSEPRGPFHWARTADSTVRRWLASPLLDYFEGEHDGYAPARHVRRVVIVPEVSIVVQDTVIAPGSHVAEVNWHLHPAWHVCAEDTGRLQLTHESGARVWMLHHPGTLEVRRGEDGGLGWYSPRYGLAVPSTTVRLMVEAHGVLSIATVLGKGECAHAPHLESVPWRAADAGGVCRGASAIQLLAPNRSDLFLFGALDDQRPRLRADDLETDARFLYRRRSHAALSTLAELDGSQVRDLRQGRPQVGPGGLVEGLLVRTGTLTALFS